MKNRYLILFTFMLYLIMVIDSLLINLFIIGAFIIYIYFRKANLLGYFLLISLLLCFRIFIGSSSTNLYQVVNIGENKYLLKQNDQYHYLYTKKILTRSSVIELEAECDEFVGTNNFNIFNYQKYLEGKNIQCKFETDDFDIITKDKIKSYFDNKIEKIKDEKIKKIIKKMILGYDIKLTSNLESYDLEYLLSNSGSYYSMFSFGFKKIFSLFIISEYVEIINIICLLMMGIVGEYNVGLMRVIIGQLLNVFFKKRLSYHDLIGLKYLLLIFYSPSSVHELGFILPFVLNIINIFSYYDKKKSYLNSLFALIPLLLRINFKIKLSFFISAFFALGYFWVFLLSYLVYFFPFFSFFLERYYCILENILSYLAVFNLEIMSGYFSFYELIIWYGILFYIMLDDGLDFKKYLSLILLCFYIEFRLIFSFNGSVTFLDVGQGDCILITFPFCNKIVMIDTGGNLNYDVAANIIYPYLKSEGVDKIDYLVITHDDIDHSYGYESLKELIKINKVIKDHSDFKVQGYLFKSLNTNKYDNENDNSLVYYTNINGLYYLFTGDIGIKVENDILNEFGNIRVDVLKLGHHGSKNSTSDKLLDITNVKLAIISCGKNNRYHHPSDEVITKLEQRNIKFFDTSKHGMIKIKYNFFSNRVISYLK